MRRAPRRRLLQILPAALLVLAAGCGPSSEPAGETAGPAAGSGPGPAGLEVREPRASLQGGTGAVYLTVVNPGPDADRLLRVETAAALRAETHESVVEGDMVRMVARPEGFEVPAGGTLALEPGGRHVMLIEPRPAAAETAIPLTLHFERAGAIEVRAALAAPAGEDHSGHEGMDHSGHAGMDHSDHSAPSDHSDHADHAAPASPPPSATPEPR